ncbi:hypothetical protein XPA_000145 [Xanthoria parietina]
MSHCEHLSTSLRRCCSPNFLAAFLLFRGVIRTVSSMNSSMASTPSAIPLCRPARVSQDAFITVLWAGVAIAFLSFLIRVIVRLKVFHKLFADDPLVLFSCILLLTNAITWQVLKEDLYLNIAVSSGQLYPPPADFPQRTERYLRASVAIILFFYTGLWAIKLSFLVFFKKLGENVRHQTLIWWGVLAVTCASYFVCLGMTYYKCLASSFKYIQPHCVLPATVAFQRNTLLVNMILDVVTDVLIIIVPVNLLWKVKISLRQKVALGGIFSITVIIILFAIIRDVMVSSLSQLLDQTWLYLWSSVEQTVSIMVACLASSRALFTRSQGTPGQHRISDEATRVDSSASSRWLLVFNQAFRKPSIFTKTSSKASRSGRSGPIGLRPVPLFARENHRTSISAGKKPWQHHNEPSYGSEEYIFPLDRVHVKQEINLA